MKRILGVFFLSLATLHSMDGEAGISLGVLGVGLNSGMGITDGCLYGRLLNFMYQSEAGLGVTASPFVFSQSIENDEYSSMTFINASLFYNFFRQTRSFLILGPFVSVNAINYNYPQFVEFRSGLVFSVRNVLREIYYGNNSIFDSDVVTVELGYKYNKIDKHRFQAQVGIDLVAVLMFLALGSEERVKEHKDEERLR